MKLFQQSEQYGFTRCISSRMRGLSPRLRLSVWWAPRSFTNSVLAQRLRCACVIWRKTQAKWPNRVPP